MEQGQQLSTSREAIEVPPGEDLDQAPVRSRSFLAFRRFLVVSSFAHERLWLMLPCNAVLAEQSGELTLNGMGRRIGHERRVPSFGRSLNGATPHILGGPWPHISWSTSSLTTWASHSSP